MKIIFNFIMFLMLFCFSAKSLVFSAPDSSLEFSENGDGVDSENEYKEKILKPGDRLEVKIFPEDPYIKGGEVEVNADGNITLPLIGKVKVADMTLVQVEESITQTLAADYFVNPEVAIIYREQNKQIIGPSFLVLGAVKQPGTYHLPGSGKPVKLLEAILMAGGFSEVANQKKIKIVRDVNGSKNSMRVNAEEILNGSQPDVPIKGGDIIHVSESVF